MAKVANNSLFILINFMKKECCANNPVWKWVLGIFFFLVAIYVVFSISTMIVFKFQRMGDWSEGNRLMVGKSLWCQKDGNCNCGGMMKGWGREDKTDVVRIFGTIVKVDGNMVTVLNNGAKEQVVVSTADTVIMSSSTEVGLSALKSDLGAVFVGSMNTENQLEAKLIQLQ